MNYWYKLQHEGVSKQLCWVKEVGQKRIHTVSSPSRKTRERYKLIDSDIRQASGHLGKDGWEGHEGSVTEVHKDILGVMNMFIFLIMVMISLVHAYVKIYQTVPFKYVQFMVCKLYIF